MQHDKTRSFAEGEAGTLTSRRSVLAGATVAGLMVPLALARAENAHHHHQGEAQPQQDLIDAGLKCVNRGEVCTAHCIDLLGQGDTSLKDCLSAVSAMTPMCALLARYAALDAPRLKELAKVCIDVCNDCADACREHAQKHEACKACQESCEACAKACKDLVRA